MDFLFARKVLGADDLHDLDTVPRMSDRCRRMLLLLHRSHNYEAFVHLYIAVQRDKAYDWIVRQIADEISGCSELTITDELPTSVSQNRLTENESDVVDSADSCCQSPTTQQNAAVCRLVTSVSAETQTDEEWRQNNDDSLERERDKHADQMTAVIDDFTRRLADHELDMMRARLQVARIATVKDIQAYPVKHDIADGKRVLGLTLLAGQLFVVRAQSRDIEVYEADSVRDGRFVLRRRLPVGDLGDVTDMVACHRHRRLYIGDRSSNVVHVINIDADNEEGDGSVTTRRRAWRVDDTPSGLSVNHVGNVLVTCPRTQTIRKFAPDGNPVRQIRLQPPQRLGGGRQAADLFASPSHAIDLGYDQYVVCHGGHGDRFHRVCIVKSVDDGRCIERLHWLGQEPSAERFRVDGPSYLSVNGLVFVADRNNGRIVVLSPSMKWVGQLETPSGALRRPEKIVFDTETDRLFVADNGDSDMNGGDVGQIKIFNVS